MGRAARKAAADLPRAANDAAPPCPVERAADAAMAAAPGRYEARDRRTVGVLLATGVPLPALAAAEVDRLARGWLEAAREQRLRGRGAPVEIVDRMRASPIPSLCRWAELAAETSVDLYLPLE